MISTSNEKYYNRMKLLRQHGMSVNDRERHVSSKVIFEDYLELGYNYRMTDIQVAVGIEQLKKIDWIVAERKKIAKMYHEAFKNIDYIELPIEKKLYSSNYQSYSILLKDNCLVTRDDLMQTLLDLGVSTRKGVMNIHRTTAYSNLKLSLPISEKLEDQSIIIPLYIPMNLDEINFVVNSIKSIIN